jgi:glycosyltransferase involved in cell wall biosynthesis
MKILCIMDSVSRANGGIFEAERKLQQNLAARGAEVQVIGLQDAHTESDRAAWRLLEPRAYPVTGPAAFGFAPELTRALMKSEADLGYLVGLWKYPSVAAQHWARRTGRPLVIAPHGMLDAWALKNSGFKKRIAGLLFQHEQLRRASCVRALCPAEVNSIRAYGITAPVCIVPNGIDLPELEKDAAPRHPLLPRGKKILFYLGQLHPKKGLVPLIAAWSKARASGEDWILAIAGWGQGGHEAELKRLATESGLAWADGSTPTDGNTSLYFLGPQFGDDKDACYRSCDAFILPSLSEGLPMAVLEAWAYAKPVLMTDACNLPEGFATRSALRIEPNEKSIGRGLGELFEMSEADRQKMGLRGRGLAETRFAWPKLAGEMSAVFRWLVGADSKPDCVVN